MQPKAAESSARVSTILKAFQRVMLTEYGWSLSLQLECTTRRSNMESTENIPIGIHTFRRACRKIEQDKPAAFLWLAMFSKGQLCSSIVGEVLLLYALKRCWILLPSR